MSDRIQAIEVVLKAIEDPKCTCEWVSIEVGYQRVAETVDCPTHTAFGEAVMAVDALAEAGLFRDESDDVEREPAPSAPLAANRYVVEELARLKNDAAFLRRERDRLRDSLARTKAAHDKARQILGADVEPIEDAAARVVRELTIADVGFLRREEELQDLRRDVGGIAESLEKTATNEERGGGDLPRSFARTLRDYADALRSSLAKTDDTPAGAS